MATTARIIMIIEAIISELVMVDSYGSGPKATTTGIYTRTIIGYRILSFLSGLRRRHLSILDI
jgi:hypothetical protein